MATTDERLPLAASQVKLGAGNQVDVEFSPGRLWLAVGRAVEEASVWMKDVAGFDIRLGIERLPDGLLIILDRGGNQPAWWTEGHAPEFILRVNSESRVVTVTARGPACITSEVLVARTDI